MRIEKRIETQFNNGRVQAALESLRGEAGEVTAISDVVTIDTQTGDLVFENVRYTEESFTTEGKLTLSYPGHVMAFLFQRATTGADIECVAQHALKQEWGDEAWIRHMADSFLEELDSDV